jgi:glucose-6-phosphate isomerase
MKPINIWIDDALKMANPSVMNGLEESLKSADYTLSHRKGAGKEFTGWLDLPEKAPHELQEQIELAAEQLRNISGYIVVVGIGGSYLGTRAVLEALGNHFHHLQRPDSFPHILFAGHHLSASYHADLLNLLQDKDYSMIVISKSGTTTEPAIAFRLLKQQLSEKYGEKNIQRRIIAITDASQGALRKMADNEGYTSFIVPDDVGGRYSVLSPVGLMPLAATGINIKEILDGATQMKTIIKKDPVNNPAGQYALARMAMYYSGKPLEIMVNYEPGLALFAEWWKQLFGESEGKEGKGIFPAAVSNTTDLHSMGQYIQDGLRILFETVISVESDPKEVSIPYDTQNLDGLNYLAGRNLTDVNQIAEEATRQAHIDGGVPNIRITVPELTPYYIGQCIYMFEYACGLSAYMLGVNPFDQPGVEAYKTNMFKLLGKP